MTEAQKEIVYKSIILLDKKDVKEITGWGENTVNREFAKEGFPILKVGKKAQVEMNAFLNYLQTRR